MNVQNQLVQRAEQGLALLPQMLQSIEILQLSTLDLLARIETEAAANEVLEAVRPSTEAAAETPSASARSEEAFDPDRYRAPTATGAERTDAHYAVLQNQAESPPGLREAVAEQLAWRELEASLRERVERALDAIDDRGLLVLSHGELAELFGGAEWIDPVRAVLRTLEPRGVGAASSVEAMLWQIDPADPDFELIECLLSQHLDALARNRLPDVARELAIDVDLLVDLLERVRRLDPRPGAAWTEGAAQPVRTDLIVVRDLASEVPGAFRVVVDDVELPVLTLNSDYVQLATGSADRTTRDYLRERIRSARDLITAVRHRNATLARVGAAVMARQRAFLHHGRRGMRPLKMEEIATEVGLHPSTVSRAIAGKYVQTEHGAFALRDFFDGDRLKTAGRDDGGRGRIAISEEIRRLLADEDRQAPLSDDEIVARLASRGVTMARRTVAKYRKELGIGPSWQRKRYGSR